MRKKSFLPISNNFKCLLRKFNAHEKSTCESLHKCFLTVICTRFELVTSCLSSKRSKPTELTDHISQVVRRDWDSNPGTAFGGYTLSRRAPSTTRPSLLS